MKKFGLIIAAFIVLCGFSTVSFAQHHRNINQRQRHQQQRVRRGMRNGSMTIGERRHIERRERSINREERHMRRNGLNKHERRTLNRRLNRTSRTIYRKKHNRVRSR